MKLLVSDYDNTIKPLGSGVSSETIDGIRRFMSDNNKFMIATARNYEYIVNEIDKYGIPCDYVSTMNGFFIHDKTGNLVYSKFKFLFDIMDYDKYLSCVKKINYFKHKDRSVYFFIYSKFLQCFRDLILFLRDNCDFIDDCLLDRFMDIKPFSNKVESIVYIQKYLGISDDDVVTIGDDSDDLEMLKKYYSYCVVGFLSNGKVLEACNQKVKSIDALFVKNKNI